MLDHAADHDPITEMFHCEVCAGIVRRTLNELAGLDLGPKDADILIARIREMAK